jgi:hypothetical protein
LWTWCVLAPLYAAALVFVILIPILAPWVLMLPSQEGGLLIVKDPLQIGYILVGFSIMGAGYTFSTALVPAALTGLTRAVIKLFRCQKKLLDRLTYVAAIGFSALAAIYFSLLMGWLFKFMFLPAVFATLIVFLGFGVLCSWLAVRPRESWKGLRERVS